MMTKVLDLIISPVKAAAPVSTAIGSLPVTEEAIVNLVISIAAPVAGGAAILLVIKGGYEILTSGGNPEQIKSGKDTIVNALMGMGLILLSVVILRIIGDILDIPLGF